ncbi:hypothetical protein BH18ACT10_BH18ACT10_18710 [soil metagenome]
MRLMGLPNIRSYPNATVTRHEEYISMVFGGKDGEQTINVPLKYMAGDPEEAELMLLARLREIGYEVRRVAD